MKTSIARWRSFPFRLLTAWVGVACLTVASVAADTAVTPPLQPGPNYTVVLPRTAFGKDYLISASIIPQELAPTSTGLAGRIVQFRLYSDGVDMYESTTGMVVTHDLPARRLLATFPIVQQDDQKVVINFNQGMRRVFAQAWTSGGTFNPMMRDYVLEVPDSRVFAVRRQGDQLVIRQSVQTRNRMYMQNVESRDEVRYFIVPYHPGHFVGKEISPAMHRYLRYFLSQGQIQPVTGRLSADIARFDITHPIHFYYSANTPAPYVQAVKDGILYWNQVFGKDVIQVAEAPGGVTAPNARYNIIQWVPWDDAGFAYADLLLDPRTGQALHGQAYITSVFAVLGKARARVLLRTLEGYLGPKSGGKKDKTTPELGVPFLASAPGCHLDPRTFAEQYAQGLEDLLSSDHLTDEAVLRVSQDYVRETVAHEVGHLLGLRHNFAGSLAATLTQNQLDAWFKAFVAGKDVKKYADKLASSSIMDYTIFKGAVFIGWQIEHHYGPMPHDKAAIAWGYFDSDAARTKKLLFATDEDTLKYGDVRTFDYGPYPVVSAYGALADDIEHLPNNLIETFIRARAPRDPRDRVPLKQINLSVQRYAGMLTAQYGEMLRWFRSDVRSLRVENQFDFIGDLNRKARLKANWKSLEAQIKMLGGVNRAFFSFLPVKLNLESKGKPTTVPVAPQLSATNLTARLEKLLNSPAYQTFVGLDGKKYHFTKEEKALILKRGKAFFHDLDRAVVRQICQRLERAPRNLDLAANGSLGADDDVAQLEHGITTLARQVITAKDSKERIQGQVNKSYVEVVDFKYNNTTRLAAAKALNDKIGSYKDWATDAKGELRNQLKSEIENALNISHFKDFKVSMLSRPLREWYLRQAVILGLLPPANGR